jgi:prolipoprotein diacylglyceryltransferase
LEKLGVFVAVLRTATKTPNFSNGLKRGPLSLFAILIGGGASLGLWQVARAAPERQAGRWVDAGLGVLGGMLLGARAAYVSQHPAYYAARPWEWLQLWQGGYSAWGAIPGGLLVVAIVALLIKQSFPLVLDRLAPLFPPLAILAWLGCAANGCSYGPALAPGTILAVPLVDEWGQVLPRFPLQFTAALILLGYNWVITFVLPGQTVPGRRAALTGLGLAIVQWIVAILSVEPAPFWNGLSYDAWAALALGMLSLILAGSTFIRR